jgi:hypothetical protein
LTSYGTDPAHRDRARRRSRTRTVTCEGGRSRQAFDDFVAQPLVANLAKLTGRDLAKRNPMV